METLAPRSTAALLADTSSFFVSSMSADEIWPKNRMEKKSLVKGKIFGMRFLGKLFHRPDLDAARFTLPKIEFLFSAAKFAAAQPNKSQQFHQSFNMINSA